MSFLLVLLYNLKERSVRTLSLVTLKFAGKPYSRVVRWLWVTYCFAGPSNLHRCLEQPLGSVLLLGLTTGICTTAWTDHWNLYYCLEWPLESVLLEKGKTICTGSPLPCPCNRMALHCLYSPALTMPPWLLLSVLLRNCSYCSAGVAVGEYLTPSSGCIMSPKTTHMNILVYIWFPLTVGCR